jgi:hypothetical protein
VGYDNTSVIPRTLDGNTSSRSNRYYHAFCFKIFAAEDSPDDRKLEGFNDRTFRRNIINGKPSIYVKKLSEKTDSKKYKNWFRIRNWFLHIEQLNVSDVIGVIIHTSLTYF